MKFHFRGFISLFLLLAFLVLGLSGVVLYVTPRGRVANWTGWTLLGLDKATWQTVHIGIALLFLIGALLHLWLNWNVVWCYVKQKGSTALNLKVEMLAALVLAAAVVAGAIFQVPPLSSLMDLNYRIKDHWDRWADEATASPPAPHAEEMPLKRLAADMNVPLDDLVKALNGEGIVADGDDRTLGELAEKHGLTPGDLYAAIRKHFPDAPQSRQGLGQGKGKGKGQGGEGKGRGRGGVME